MGRAKGTGCVYKVNGWYYMAFRRNGKRKDIALRTQNEKEANIKIRELVGVRQMMQNKEMLKSFLIGLSEDTPQIDEKKGVIKFKKTFELYLKHPNKPDSGDSTLKNYERIWNKFAEGVHYGYLEELQEHDAIKYAEALIENGVSDSTFNYHTGSLKLIFKTLLPKMENPFDSVRRKKVKSVKHKPLTSPELKRLLKYTHGEIKLLFTIGAYTGLRLKDAVSLKYEQIKNNIICLTPVKTQKYGTKVQIPLHPEIKNMLSNRRGYIMPTLAKLSGDALSGRVQKVFKDAGFHSEDSTIGRQRKACIYGFHSLRHTFVSRLANSGVSLALIGKMTGHTTEKMTDHYYEADMESLRKAIKSI